MFISPITLILVTIIVFVVYMINTKWKFFVLWWKIGGPCPIPYTVPIEMTKVDKLLYASQKWANKDGTDWYGFSWMGPIPVLYVADPHIMQIILTSQHCINKPIFYGTMTQTFGPGLVSINNPEWSRSRKLMNPLFTHRNILSFIPIFNKQTDILNKILNKYVDSEPVELFSIIAKCTFDIASETTLGTQLNAQTQEQCDKWEAYVNLLHICMERTIRFWLLAKPLFKLSSLYKIFEKDKNILHNWIQKVQHDKLTAIEKDGVQLDKTNISESKDINDNDCGIRKFKSVFIDHANELVQRNEISWSDFESHANSFIIGSFETSATTIQNVLMMLAMHPEVQEKVFKEIYSLFPNKNFNVNYEDIQNMPYLDMVLNETFRVITTVPILAREVSQDIELKKGVFVPKSTVVVIDIFNLHRNPLYWGENSDKFDPEHVSPENMVDKHQFAFIPFLKGARQCIGIKYAGMSLKVILAKIIRNYRFTTDFKYENLQFFPAVSIKFRETPKIKIYRRE